MTLPAGWTIVNEHHLQREYTFPDFASALAFVNRVGAAAEEANHHPDIHLSWGKVGIEVWTHDAGGITARDHALADTIERLWHHAQGPI